MTKVLDEGYLELVTRWGSDEAIIEAARMSTDKGFLGWGPKHPLSCLASSYGATEADCTCKNPKPGDENLLRYLFTHNHTTPFEMAGMTVEVKAPIFVFREWHRHRTQSYNEMSARYIPLPNENYLPDIGRLLLTDNKNKQAQSTGQQLTPVGAANARNKISTIYSHIQIAYNELLELGVPKELARLIIPVGRYSKMRASANLLNWIRFLRLRREKSAQWEIRQYANALFELLAKHFPRTMLLHEEEMREQ